MLPIMEVRNMSYCNASTKSPHFSNTPKLSLLSRGERAVRKATVLFVGTKKLILFLPPSKFF